MKIVHELDHQEWSEFVQRHPQGNIFQTPEVYEVYKRTKYYEPCVIGAISDAGQILAVLLAVIQREYGNHLGDLTERSIIWGGPLVKGDDADILAFILHEYENDVGSLAIYTQIRNLGDISVNRNVFESAGYAYEEHLNIVVDLSKSEDLLWKEVHSKRRNEIRRAQKEGTYVRELDKLPEIEEMYDILDEVYHYAKLPFVDKSIFIAAFEILRPIGLCRYFGAFNKGTLVGTMCLLTYKQHLYDWYAGSRREYLNKYPNDLLPWEVFKWGRQNSYRIFDFGGAGKPDKDYGVRDYKRKFGGELVNFGRFQKVHKPMTYLLAKAGYSAWRFFKGRISVGAKQS
jgi:serine/alanine adding enzyme